MRYFAKGSFRLIKPTITKKEAVEFLNSNNSETWANEVVKQKTVDKIDIGHGKTKDYGQAIYVDYIILDENEEAVQQRLDLFATQVKEQFKCEIQKCDDAIGYTKGGE